MPLIEDIKMKIESDYFETTKMAGSDYRPCNENYAIWQAFEGELKTKLGTCYGVGLTTATYGSELHTLLGENLNDYMPSEIEKMVKDVADRYPYEIRTFKINFDSIDLREGSISMEITIYTMFGPITEIFYYDKGCV